MKQCTICGDDSPIAWHGKKCRKCWEASQKSRHQTPQCRYKHSIRGAKARKKEWCISFEEFCELIKKPCTYCNNLIGCIESFGTGLDRIDNNRGYYPDNVIPCCKVCNSMRNRYFTIEEIKIAVQAIISHRKLNEVNL